MDEFQKFMASKYGEKQFKDGFSIIEDNSRIVYAQDGDGRLAVLLKDVPFTDTNQLQEFIKESSLYLVSNMTQFWCTLSAEEADEQSTKKLKQQQKRVTKITSTIIYVKDNQLLLMQGKKSSNFKIRFVII